MKNPPLIELQSITLQREQTVILKDLNWSLRAGEHWVVFGPNGAGKTTLLNVLQGYQWATEGTVQILGGTLGDGVDVRELREHIAVVSESVRNLINPQLTGFEVVVTGGRAHLNLFDEITSAEKDHALEIARTTALEPLLEKPYAIMSTGERQRVLIARALMLKPSLLILDEPCSGLDLAAREWVLQTMNLVAQAPGAPSILLTTHHVEEITPSFTHALLLSGGGIVAAGPIAEVFTSRNLSALYGMPLELRHHQGRYSAVAIHPQKMVAN